MMSPIIAAIITEAQSSPPIRVPPPWIIIPPWVIIRIGVRIIIFFPEMDLFARNKRIPIIHLSERYNLFP
jgi:hypothetical protein